MWLLDISNIPTKKKKKQSTLNTLDIKGFKLKDIYNSFAYYFIK